jgi:hypothetical protein
MSATFGHCTASNRHAAQRSIETTSFSSCASSIEASLSSRRLSRVGEAPLLLIADEVKANLIAQGWVEQPPNATWWDNTDRIRRRELGHSGERRAAERMRRLRAVNANRIPVTTP